MKRFKKILCMMTALILLLSLAACQKAPKNTLQESHNGVTLTYVSGSDTIIVSGKGEFGDNYWFYNDVDKETIKKVIVKKGITSISGYFRDLPNLKEISLPSSLTKICNCFDNCDGLEKVRLPKSLRTVYGSFSDCDSLREIDLRKVTEINYSFKQCSALKQIAFPKSIKNITESFYNCDALTEIEPQAAILIEGSFESCDGLKEIALPADSVLCGAFNDCAKLQTIRLGANVSCHNLGDGCEESFMGRKVAQRTIYAQEPLHMKATTAITAGIDELNMSLPQTKLIPVPEKEGADPQTVKLPAPRYQIDFDEESGVLTVSGFGLLSDLYPRTLLSGPDYGYNTELLEEDHQVKKLVIGEGITHLFNCFNDLLEMEELSLPQSLESVGCSFIGCSSLKTLSTPEKLKTIHNSFNNATALEALQLGGAIDTCYYGSTFSGLDSLKEVTIPAGSTLCNAFQGCSRLKKVTLQGEIELHEFKNDIDDSYCYSSFKDAAKNCTFHLNSAMYQAIFQPNYNGPIHNTDRYRFIVADGETPDINREQKQLYVPFS